MPGTGVCYTDFELNLSVHLAGFKFDLCCIHYQVWQIVISYLHHIMTVVIVTCVDFRTGCPLRCFDCCVSLKRSIIDNHMTRLAGLIIAFISGLGVWAIQPFAIRVVDLSVPKFCIMTWGTKLTLTKDR